MVFRDVGAYVPSDINYDSYNKLNWIEDGVSVDSSGNVRISYSTSFINGNNVSPFVSGWSEVEFIYDDYYKPSGTTYHPKSDITSNVWPHTGQYIKFFDFQKLDKYLDMNIGANLTNCTITQSGLTPIFSGIVELDRGYTVSGNMIVSGAINPTDTIQMNSSKIKIYSTNDPVMQSESVDGDIRTYSIVGYGSSDYNFIDLGMIYDLHKVVFYFGPGDSFTDGNFQYLATTSGSDAPWNQSTWVWETGVVQAAATYVPTTSGYSWGPVNYIECSGVGSVDKFSARWIKFKANSGSNRIYEIEAVPAMSGALLSDDSYNFLYESGLWFNPTATTDNTNWNWFECNITNSGSGTFMLVEVSGNMNLGALEFGVSGAYHSSSKALWNYYDELGILAGLERMPGESNVDFKARIKSQLTYKPGVSHQGIVNGLAAELGLTRYNVETKTLYNLANIPAMYLDPDVRTSGIAPISVWVNDVAWGRVYETVSSDWSGYFLNDSQPSGTPLYYDTHGNVAVTSGWIIWRDPEGQYTNRLEVLGAPDKAVIKVQYYILDSNNKARAIIEGGDPTDEYWLAKTPTSGNYSVITFNDNTIQSLLLTGSGSYIKSVVEEVRDKAPAEYGKLRFGHNFWPITHGSFTGLSSIFDASTSGA